MHDAAVHETEASTVVASSSSVRERFPPAPPAAQVPAQPLSPAPRDTRLAGVALGVMVLALTVFACMYLTQGAPSTFPYDFADFTEREARLARKIPGKTISAEEVAAGVLEDGVLIKDVVDVLTAAIVYNPEQMIVPIYYGDDFNYAVLAFSTERGATVLLNPSIHKSSGVATVTQEPRFCSMARDYRLPTRVVVSGTPHNSTVYTRSEFAGARAAMAYTMIRQLSGQDVCDPGWE